MREMCVIEPGGRYGGFDCRPADLAGGSAAVAVLDRRQPARHPPDRSRVYRHIAANRIRQGKCTDEFCVP